jgi:ABC-type transporter Mla subunit MlaD
MGEFGRVLILFGVVLIAVGALLTLAGRLPWLGKLPGDMFYKGDHVTVYFPLATCVVISVVLSLLFYLFRR